MEFRILGRVHVWAGGRSLPVGEPRQQAILAALLVDADRPVSVDTLVDRVWGDSPPPQARRSLQAHVAKIRRALHDAADAESGEGIGEPVPQPLVRTSGGYVISAGIEQVDALRFRDLVAQCRPDTVDERRRASRLGEALGLWRGEPLAGVAGSWAGRTRRTLRQEHTDATVMWARAEIRLGNASAALGPLTVLAEEHPTLETAAATLMWALQAAGRPSDALDHYDNIRKRLRDMFGADPGPDLHASYQAVLRHDMTLFAGAGARPAGPATPVPEQLPADVSAFVGRSGELAELDRFLAESALLCITGTAGVGKTALAVHWAHRVRDRFPDGQLFADLRGFHPAGPPAAPEDVLRDFLVALNVTSDHIPTQPAARSALYRTLLTGRRVLVVLDNAGDADQVRPLLPGSAGCLAVVTSRNRLAGLLAGGARPVPVDLMSADEAATLLGQRIGAHRLTSEPTAARQVIERCGGLPIALAVAAARAATNPRFSLASIAAELGDAQRGLDALDGGDMTTDVRAVLSWSYHRLDPDHARMFRLLGLAPGPDVTAPAAARLTGVPHPHARSALSALARVHLVDEHHPGRYSMHDLLRRYAGELANALDDDRDRRAAVDRITRHYVRAAGRAAALVAPSHRAAAARADIGPGDPLTAAQAMHWYDAERPALLATVRHAIADGLDADACDLAYALTELFDRRGHWHDWAAVTMLAQAPAARLADPVREARLHRSRARAEVWLGDTDLAYEQLCHAIERYTAVGDQTELAHTYRTLAWCLGRKGANLEAVAHARTAVDLHGTVEDRAGQGLSLNTLGWQHAHLGEYDVALRYCHEAVTLLSEAGDNNGAGYAHDSLGFIYHSLGDCTAAIVHYQQAVLLLRQTGDLYQEADTLLGLGDTRAAADDRDGATQAWRRAVDLLDQLSHPSADEARSRLHPPSPAVAQLTRSHPKDPAITGG